MHEETEDNLPPENKTLFTMALYESALRQIAAIDWPVNVAGNNPQKIAKDALK
jgi:hypothetical protein